MPGLPIAIHSITIGIKRPQVHSGMFLQYSNCVPYIEIQYTCTNKIKNKKPSNCPKSTHTHTNLLQPPSWTLLEQWYWNILRQVYSIFQFDKTLENISCTTQPANLYGYGNPQPTHDECDTLSLQAKMSSASPLGILSFLTFHLKKAVLITEQYKQHQFPNETIQRKFANELFPFQWVHCIFQNSCNFCPARRVPPANIILLNLMVL